MLMTRMLSGAQGLTYAQFVLQDGPVAFWQLNETSGTVANDVSGNGYNATYSGGVTLGKPGIPSGGNAVLFDKGLVEITTPVVTSLNSVTLEGWLNFNGVTPDTSTSAYSQFINVGTSGNGYGSGFETNSTTFEGIYGGKTFNTFSESVAVSGWNHVVYVVTSTGTSELYINGALAGTNSNSGIIAPTDYTTIGNVAGGGRSLPGTFCNVAIYNKALTATQIKNHYNAGIS